MGMLTLEILLGTERGREKQTMSICMQEAEEWQITCAVNASFRVWSLSVPGSGEVLDKLLEEIQWTQVPLQHTIERQC